MGSFDKWKNVEKNKTLHAAHPAQPFWSLEALRSHSDLKRYCVHPHVQWSLCTHVKWGALHLAAAVKIYVVVSFGCFLLLKSNSIFTSLHCLFTFHQHVDEYIMTKFQSSNFLVNLSYMDKCEMVCSKALPNYWIFKHGQAQHPKNVYQCMFQEPHRECSCILPSRPSLPPSPAFSSHEALICLFFFPDTSGSLKSMGFWMVSLLDASIKGCG